jgi:CDP-glycerol glycerophosphotransferase
VSATTRQGAAVVPEVSVVVPAHEVEEYLGPCLRSIAEQSLRDLEIVVVDDGSTDGTLEVAERFAEREARARIVRQPNQGLGRARNTGLAASAGELIMFVDSDDLLLPDALTRLRSALRRSGSDFATGMVLRSSERSTWPAPFLRKAFLRNRSRTHVSRFPWLVSDRVAWNKLWHREFLERHDLRFAEGMFHEDIPMVVPAHYLARAVDVVREPVYLWRERPGSITTRRTDPRLLRDRLKAVGMVCRFLDATQPPPLRRIYHESVLAEDLRYHLDVLDRVDDAYRAEFLDGANALLDGFAPDVESRLPAIQRLKWHLVRRRLLPELLEVIRFQETEFKSRPRVIKGGIVYGAYPFFDDPALGIPRSVYRLDPHRRRLRSALVLAKPARVPRRALR